jgi:hypothetical protein
MLVESSRVRCSGRDTGPGPYVDNRIVHASIIQFTSDLFAALTWERCVLAETLETVRCSNDVIVFDFECIDQPKAYSGIPKTLKLTGAVSTSIPQPPNARRP